MLNPGGAAPRALTSGAGLAVPASRALQDTMTPNVSEALITSPRSRRVEDNAPFGSLLFRHLDHVSIAQPEIGRIAVAPAFHRAGAV
jgi:hypothetical protein